MSLAGLKLGAWLVSSMLRRCAPEQLISVASWLAAIGILSSVRFFVWMTSLKYVAIGNESHWDAVIESMHDVLQGTEGTARAVGENAPYQMAGKSGTAQVITIAQDEEYNEDELEERQRDHALFVAFAPLEDPQIAVAVIVENGSSGSSVAAPVARAVMDAYLGYAP